MDCGCSKNQTSIKAIDYLKKSNTPLRSASTLGIGIFIVPAPENGILEWKTVYVEGIGYDECIKRGENCSSFQWVPHGFTTELSGKSFTIKSAADIRSLAGYCDDECTGGCPMGCHCRGGDVVCRPNN
jgi:hypothetical protein